MLFFLAGYVILSRFYVAQIGYFSVAQHDGFLLVILHGLFLQYKNRHFIYLQTNSVSSASFKGLKLERLDVTKFRH